MNADDERHRLLQLANGSIADFIELKKILLGDPLRILPLGSTIEDLIEQHLRESIKPQSS